VIYEKHAVKALRLHPTNAALLVLGTAGSEIKVLHAATGKALKKHKLANPVTALEAVLSGSLLVAGESSEWPLGTPRTVELARVNSGQRLTIEGSR